MEDDEGEGGGVYGFMGYILNVDGQGREWKGGLSKRGLASGMRKSVGSRG